MSKESKTKEQVLLDRLDRIGEGTSRIESKIAELISVLTTKPVVKGPGHHKRKPQELERRHPETKLVMVVANGETAKRARVGRVAKQYGIPFPEWVALHGMRDVKLPRGADPRKPTLSKAKKRRRKVNRKSSVKG